MSEERILKVLADVTETLEDALNYMPQYFREKWKYDDVVREAKQLLAEHKPE